MTPERRAELEAFAQRQQQTANTPALARIGAGLLEALCSIDERLTQLRAPKPRHQPRCDE